MLSTVMIRVARRRLRRTLGSIALITAAASAAEPLPRNWMVDGVRREALVHVPVAAGEPLGLELADFVAAVRDRRAPMVTGQAGRKALELATRVHEAMAGR